MSWSVYTGRPPAKPPYSFTRSHQVVSSIYSGDICVTEQSVNSNSSILNLNSSYKVNFILCCIAVSTGSETLVTSVFSMSLHTSIGPVTVSRCLFDSGALCKYSLIARRVIDRLQRHGVHLKVEPIDANVSPFSGAAIQAEGKVTVTMSVQDSMNIAHYATFECLIVPFKSFDVIINNDTCRLQFTRFFYNPDNFVVIHNPFKPDPCEEELNELGPDPYGQLHAVFALIAEVFDAVVAVQDSLEVQINTKVGALAEFGIAEAQMLQLERAMISHMQIFTLDNIGINNVTVDITTSDTLPQEIIAKVRPIRRDLIQMVEQELRHYTELRLHEICESPYAAPIVPVKKPDGTVRIAIDYSVGINQYITMPSIQIPIIRDILSNLSQFRYFFEIDLSKAYRQLRLSHRSSLLLSYVTPIGQFRPITLPEGVRTAPQIFSQVMYQLLRTQYKFGNEVEYYFDNIYGGAHTVDELLRVFNRIIQMCATENIKLKLSKCTVATARIKALGYIVSHGKVEVDPDRVASLIKLRPPKSKQELRSILGSFLLCSYFVPDYAMLASPLYELLKNDKEFLWTQSEDQVFEQIKVALHNTIALSYPDYTKEWILRTDGSMLGIGGCLIQLTTHNDGTVTEEIIAMLSKKLSEPAQRWSIYEIELYALIFCIKTWSTLLYGKSFVAQVDHRNLSFLQQSPLAKVNRWRLFLSDYEFVLQIIPGKSNIIADMLSRVLEEDTKASDQEIQCIWTILTEEYIRDKHLGLGHVSHYPVYRLFEIVSHELEEQKVEYKPRDLLLLIRKTVSACGFCAKEKLSAKAEVKRYRAMMVEEPYSMVGLDLVGPFPADIFGYTYILVIRDFFDRMVDLTPVIGKDSSAYLQCLLKYAATFSIPRFVRTDNGAEFTNNMVSQFNKLLNISQSFTTPYTPSGNSMTERINQEVVPQLRMYVQHKHITAQWSTYLPIIQCNVNNSFNRMIGMSPFRLRFGDRVALYPKLTDIEVNEEVSEKFVKALSIRMGIIRQIAIIIADAELTYLLSKNPEYTTIKLHDKVLVEQYNNFTRSAPSKLEPRLKGPFKVIEVLNGNLFRCKHLVTAKEETFDISHLRKFPDVTEDEAVEAAKFDEVCINRFTIMDHKTCAITSEEETNCLTYEFLIQFNDANGQPLDNFTPRWVSYTFAVENTSVFKKYCKQAGLLFMLSKPKPLSLKDRKALKEKKLTQMFGDTIQIESEEIVGEKDETDYEINDLAEIEVDNQIYDEAFIERATEFEEPINSEPIRLKKQKKRNETFQIQDRSRNNTSKQSKLVIEESTLRRSNRQRRPNVNYTGY